MELRIIFWLIFVLAAPVAFLAFIYFTIRKRIHQPQHWGAALTAGLTWGLAGLAGAFIVSEAWFTFFESLSEGYSLFETINYQVNLPGYYGMSLAGILAGALGCVVLYRLLQR